MNIRELEAAPTDWQHIDAVIADDNKFWGLSCGHHQNMLDLALERVEQLESDLRYILGTAKDLIIAYETPTRGEIPIRSHIEALDQAIIDISSTSHLEF